MFLTETCWVRDVSEGWAQPEHLTGGKNHILKAKQWFIKTIQSLRRHVTSFDHVGEKGDV